MKTAEWIELLLIAIATAASRFAWPDFPATMPLWQIVLGASALLLTQSLVRDVTILFRRSRTSEPQKEAQCFCLESTVGTTGVIAGAALIGLGDSHQIAISHRGFLIVVFGTLTMGFLIKDLVIAWKPLAVRREKNHVNLIVRWKSKAK